MISLSSFSLIGISVAYERGLTDAFPWMAAILSRLEMIALLPLFKGDAGAQLKLRGLKCWRCHRAVGSPRGAVAGGVALPDVVASRRVRAC